MKYPIACGLILLATTVSAGAQETLPRSIVPDQLDPQRHAQPHGWNQIQFGRPAIPDKIKTAQEKMPAIKTPALDAFANNGKTLELQLRWVQVDSGDLAKSLPAWDKLGKGEKTHIASPRELAELAQMRSLGLVSVSNRLIYAVNNQLADFTFSPWARLESPIVLRFDRLEPAPTAQATIPNIYNPQNPLPYIPNLALPESQLPAMAPMPGAGSKNELPAPNPYQKERHPRWLGELMKYKFQLMPNLVGDEIALSLRSVNAANNLALTASAREGETVVFSLPNILIVGNGRERRTLLLVSPRVLDSPTTNTEKAK